MAVKLLNRALVHKRDLANVFVGQPERVDELHFRTPSSFPLDHGTYNDALSGLSAAGFLIEVARQANLAISHQHYGVPLDSGFLVASIDWDFPARRPFIAGSLEPFDVHTTVLETAERKGELSALKTRTHFVDAQGHTFLSGGASFLISTRKMTTRVVAADGPEVAPCAPELVQVSRLENVLVGAPVQDEATREERQPLVVNRRHPYFFEHENTHVPGMMLLEAAKQAAVSSALRRFPMLAGHYGDLYRGEIRFSRFADLRSVTWVLARFGSLMESEGGARAEVTLEFFQRQRCIGEVRGAIGFTEVDEAVVGSAILRHQLEVQLSQAAADLPMYGAFE